MSLPPLQNSLRSIRHSTLSPKKPKKEIRRFLRIGGFLLYTKATGYADGESVMLGDHSRVASRLPKLLRELGTFVGSSGCFVGGAVGAPSVYLTLFLLSPPSCRRNKTD